MIRIAKIQKQPSPIPLSIGSIKRQRRDASSTVSVQPSTREWNRLYAVRSGLFHGTIRLSDDESRRRSTLFLALSVDFGRPL
jgi:hypothetical protein